MARMRQPLLDPRWIYRTMVERFSRNDILTYASAIAVQLLTAAIPLALLAFLLAGELGKGDIWRLEMAPVFATHASVTTYDAVDAVAEGLISSKHAVWLAAAAAIAIWEISGAVRACMGGLNRIFELEEDRPTGRRFLLSFGIAVVLAALVLGALLVASRGGGWVDLGAVQPLWTAVRWGTVVVLLWAAVGVVIRFAPNGYEPPGWLTVGSVIVIVAWIGATLVFGWWVFSVANYRTPFGTMIAFLTLIGYLYTSAIVFLVGAQIDQLLIEQARS